MTNLRQRMIEDLQLRGMSERTIGMYTRAVRQLAPLNIYPVIQITSFPAIKGQYWISGNAVLQT